jgi:hypothetical protein
MTAATDIDTTATRTAKHLIDLLLSLVFRAGRADYVLRALRDATCYPDGAEGDEEKTDKALPLTSG